MGPIYKVSSRLATEPSRNAEARTQGGAREIVPELLTPNEFPVRSPLTRDKDRLYRNDGGNRNHWITIRLEGSRSNRDAIGARVELLAGGKTQIHEVRSGGSYLSHNDMRLHFGLGATSRVDRIRVRWPNGNVEELPSLDGDRVVTIKEK